MLFFIFGASGSGKSAGVKPLQKRLPELAIYDFDAIFSTSNANDFGDWRIQPQKWRQQVTEYWLKQALANQAKQIDMVVCGGAVPGEVLACPSYPKVEKTFFCLLDCYDVDRIDRIRGRGFGTEVASQDSLSWAAWLRMHAVDPQWRQDVINTGDLPEMQWQCWNTWQRGDPRWQVDQIDTTKLSLDEVSDRLKHWIEGKLKR